MKNKKTLGFLFVASFTFISCNSDYFASIENSKSSDELLMDLKMQEERYPLIYLTVDADISENRIKVKDEEMYESAEYITDGSTIYGTIKNTATMAQFNEVVLTLTYYSNTGNEIESRDFPLTIFLGPKSINKFKLKVYPPEAMAKFNASIKNARVSD